MDSLFGKAGLNDEAKLGLLQNNVIRIQGLNSFVVCRSPIRYKELKKFVTYFEAIKRSIHAAKCFVDNGSSALMTKEKREVPHPEVKTFNVENNIDTIAYQLVELSLLLKKQ